MEDRIKITTAYLKPGQRIGVLIEFDGEKRAVAVENPFWPEINKAWHEAHPWHRCKNECDVCNALPREEVLNG